MFNVFVDASVRTNQSVHSYCVFDKEGIFVSGHVFKGNLKTSIEAEKFSIEQALRHIKERGFKNATIFTDSSPAADKINEKLNKKTKKQGKVQWISRKENQLADLACSSGDVHFYEKNKTLVKLWGKISSFPKPPMLTLNKIGPLNVADRHKEEMLHLYKEITGKDTTIQTIFNWCKGKETWNSHEGRAYLVGQFILYTYFTSNHEKRVQKVIRDKAKLVEGARFIGLSEKAYHQYINLTKYNKQLTQNQARRKLYRDIQLAVIDTRCKRTQETVYHYGDLKITVKENIIHCVEKAPYVPKGWRKNIQIYNEMNQILGITY